MSIAPGTGADVMSEIVIDFELIPATSGKVLTTGLFGSQARLFPWFEQIALRELGRQPETWVDPSAGTGSMPNSWAKKGVHVFVNDLSLWQHAGHQTVFNDPTWTQDELQYPKEFVSESHVHDGVLVEKSFFADEVNKYLDQLVVWAWTQPRTCWPILAAIGHFINNRATFRGLEWDWKYAKQWNVGHVHRAIDWQLKNGPLKHKTPGMGLCFNMSGEDFVQSPYTQYEPPGGYDITYHDFPWPWADGKETGTYHHMYQLMSQALLQSSELPPWTTWDKDTIWDKLELIVGAAHEHSKVVMLDGQTSNYPPFQELRQWVQDRFGEHRVYVLPVKPLSHLQGVGQGRLYSYKEFVFAWKGKRWVD
jgi:hypothetical protein